MNVNYNSDEFQERFCPGIVQVNENEIYIFGGYGNKQALRDFWIFTPQQALVKK